VNTSQTTSGSGPLTDGDIEFLLSLLHVDTVTPMETKAASGLPAAMTKIASYASEAGMETILLEPPPAEILNRPDVPVSVAEVAASMGPFFIAGQPNLVLGIGRPQGRQQTLMFNVHIDTVGGLFPVRRVGNRIFGRGVIDAKGLVVPIVAGVRRAFAQIPDVGEQVCVLVQCVGGEEGGAMGVYGTRHLFEQGYYGALNIVAEPTELRYFDRSTTSMTARIAVNGAGSTDDEPQQGQNATVLLAALADHLARDLAPKIVSIGAKICIAGLHTGCMHNRVYGNGALLVNFAYPTVRVAHEIERLTTECFTLGLQRFQEDFSQSPVVANTADAASRICRLQWLKRRLPVLDNRNPDFEKLLSGIGVDRHAEDEQASRFTCDAMWLQASDCYTIVLGPAHLGRNNAHADDEHVDIEELESFADMVSRIVHAFAHRHGSPSRIRHGSSNGR
jgi:acetylornithine deacetylase/succinyl-diaminopimelate desuccinylase-like protein